MADITPTVGRIVLYRMSAQDAATTNQRRSHAKDKMEWHRLLKTGAQVHFGNTVNEGDVYPAIVVRVWGDQSTSAVNLKVFLDGTDDFWATSVSVGEQPGNYHWMAYQKAVAAGEILPNIHAGDIK